MDSETDSGKVIVSQTFLQTDKYGVYLIPDDNPAIEYHIIGGCSSIDYAKERIQELSTQNTGLLGAGLDPATIEFRERPKAETDNMVQLLTVDELAESIRAHFDRSIAQLTKSTVIKVLLSYENSIFLLCVIAIWLFWTHGSFTVPKGIDLPLIGNRLDGIVLKGETVARYFPIALLALYFAKFLSMLRTNLEYDLLRRKLLVLVINHGWRLQQFVLLMVGVRKSAEKSGLGWLVNVSDWFHDLDPASLGNLRKQSALATQEAAAGQPSLKPSNKISHQAPPSSVQAELDKKLAEWVPNEFDRRVHHLYFLDKEKDYSRFAMCFDPVLYLTSLNRILFRVYEFLRDKGAPVDAMNAPTDPYLVQRVAGLAFWFSVSWHVVFLGGTMAWSLFVASTLPKLLFLANLLAMVLVLIVPNWWNYLAFVRHRGFPKMEPLGAYTVGSMSPNRLSLL